MASCPLYKRMRTKGTSFFAFPSSSNDMNIYPFQDDISMYMSKFVLLNIPTSVQADGVLNFAKADVTNPALGINMYNFDPNPSYPVHYSEQLVESIRNYIANQDAEFRESKISTNKDFYNPKEYKTPTEMIFWKWCKLNNIIDFETAEHKIDWDKNLPDFDNPNASTISNQDYFRKYLWKEREVTQYNCVISTTGSDLEVSIVGTAKFICEVSIPTEDADGNVSDVPASAVGWTWGTSPICQLFKLAVEERRIQEVSMQGYAEQSELITEEKTNKDGEKYDEVIGIDVKKCIINKLSLVTSEGAVRGSDIIQASKKNDEVKEVKKLFELENEKDVDVEDEEVVKESEELDMDKILEMFSEIKATLDCLEERVDELVAGKAITPDDDSTETVLTESKDEEIEQSKLLEMFKKHISGEQNGT